MLTCDAAKTELIISQRGAVMVSRLLGEGDYVIGRLGADIVVEEEGIAPRHVRLTIEKGGLTLTDLASAAGTYLEGRRLNGPVRLRPAQVARLGESVQLVTRRLAPEEDSSAGATLRPHAASIRRLLPEFFLNNQKYRRGKIVDQGGMGIVLEAEEAATGRRVAMKVMKQPEQDGSDLRRFVAEARITALLEHPNIVPIHELGLDDDERLFYTMKFVQGATLQEVLHRLAEGNAEAARLHPLPQLLTVFQKACDAIAFAHSQRVIHRDLKPANIMLGPFGEVLVMDWGLAKRMARQPGDGFFTEPEEKTLEYPSAAAGQPPLADGATADGTLAGTPHFMPPEQAEGRIAAVDERSDLYALGAILYCILTLQPPVRGGSIEEVLQRVREGRLEPIAAAEGLPHLPGGRVPESLAAVALRSMARRPEDRYTSVAELQREIAAYQAGFATNAEQAGFFKQLALAVRRHRREAAILLASICIVIALAAAAFLTVAGERTRASTALADLRGAAPVFAAQARALAMQDHVGEALNKLDYALTLRPGATEYLLAKADLLESQLRFREAAGIYSAVLAAMPDHARARQHAALCGELAGQRADSPLFKSALCKLLEAMSREKRLEFEVQSVAMALGVHPDVARRLRLGEDGLLVLDLSHSPLSDLDMLRGLPLGSLDIAGCKALASLEFARELPLHTLILEGSGVADIAPLATVRTLRRLNIAFTDVANLDPLRGLPLTSLDCSGIPAVDFSPLAGMPVETLRMQDCAATDLSFVSGMPLKTLTLRGCDRLRNFSALCGLPLLAAVCLPEHFYRLPAEDLRAVRALCANGTLRQLSAAALDRSALQSAETKEAFWKQWSTDIAWIQALEKAGFQFTCCKLSDGTWELNLRDQQVTDLSFLAGAAISNLNLFNTPVQDLSPLRGMPLRVLDLRRASAWDLSPLKSLPLRELYLWSNKTTDFSVLSTLHSLEVLDLSETHFDDLRLIPLRSLRELRIGSSHVRNLSPIAGSKLEKIHFDKLQVADVSPLLQCPELRWLVVTRHAKNIHLLHDLKKVERISFGWNSESEPAQTAQEFWQEFSQPWARRLRLAGVKFTSKQFADASWSVSVDPSKPFDDLRIFKGANISELNVEGTRVANLSPLASLPLTALSLTNTLVANLAPIRNLPLRRLHIGGTLISDLSPLLGMPLEEFSADRCANLLDFTALSKIPSLKKPRVSKFLLSD